MDARSKRKLKDVIRGIIGDGFQGTQSELARALRSRGLRVTQSTISRTMNQMGVVREAMSGKQFYRLKMDSKISYRGSLSDLIVRITHNESLIVIKTRPGSAMFVAGFLDHECQSTVLGTVAGDDTIFVAPMKTSKISLIAKEVESQLRASTGG